MAEEVAALAGGLPVKAVHQDGEHRFRVALERAGRRHDLVLDLDPDLPRAHLAAGAPAPRQPTPLAHALRNALVGARLEGARTVPGERALALTFSLGGLARTLWFEAFGRQANLYLLDEHGVVLVTPRGEAAKARGGSVGARFQPVPARPEPPAPPGPAAPAPATVPDEGASAAVERLARAQGEQRDEAARRAALARFVRQGLAKARGAVEALEAMALRGGEAPALRRRGELLRASFHLLAPGLERVRVEDHGTTPPQEVELALDPRRTAGEQVASCFHEAERAERAAAEAAQRLPGARARVATLEGVEARLRADAAADELAALEAEAGLVPTGGRPRTPKAAGPAEPWRRFRSLDGWTIRVGKDARGNDRLTLHGAAPHDLFLHVRGASGSHVIVPTPRGQSVPKETLLDAAELACLYSGRAQAEHNEVDYVERRHVRKPRGAPPGLVELARAKTLRVARDDARRERLRATMS